LEAHKFLKISYRLQMDSLDKVATPPPSLLFSSQSFSSGFPKNLRSLFTNLFYRVSPLWLPALIFSISHRKLQPCFDLSERCLSPPPFVRPLSIPKTISTLFKRAQRLSFFFFFAGNHLPFSPLIQAVFSRFWAPVRRELASPR